LPFTAYPDILSIQKTINAVGIHVSENVVKGFRDYMIVPGVANKDMHLFARDPSENRLRPFLRAGNPALLSGYAQISSISLPTFR
jgi:hypothetical protein